jgi:hypothetical protein
MLHLNWRILERKASTMILPSIVTRDCTRARHFLSPGSPYNRRDKRVARRVYRRSLDQQVKRLQLDPSRFDGEALRVRRYTGWDIV